MRLDKLLSSSGAGSRKEIKSYIKKGQVLVNDKLATDSAMQVDENNDCITLFGEQIIYKKFIYLMLNKPQGYVSATFDKHYPTVCDLVPPQFAYAKVFPVGRLDIDTEGLLLLTNDGALAHNLLSPKKHVDKTYFVKSQNPITARDIEIIELGVDIGGYTTLPAKLQSVSPDNLSSLVTISEGKFHQVKKMFEAISNKVIYLKRIKMGALCLDESLKIGKVRELTNEEVASLKGE